MSEGDEHDKPSTAPDYEVGYGRPPKGTRFKPGQSGNPKGRKRRPRSVQRQVQDVLARKISITEGGKTKKLPLQEVILRNLANQSAKGDLKAATFIFNLLNSPDYADTDAIDQNSLSADDQALLDRLISQLAGSTASDGADASGLGHEYGSDAELLTEQAARASEDQTSTEEGGDYDD